MDQEELVFSSATRWLKLKRQEWLRRNRTLIILLTAFACALPIWAVVQSIFLHYYGDSLFAILAAVSSVAALYLSSEEANSLVFTPEEVLSTRDSETKSALASLARRILYLRLGTLMLIPFLASFLPFHFRPGRTHLYSIEELMVFAQIAAVAVLLAEVMTYQIISNPRSSSVLRTSYCLVLLIVLFGLIIVAMRSLADFARANEVSREFGTAVSYALPFATLLLACCFYWMTTTASARRTALRAFKH